MSGCCCCAIGHGDCDGCCCGLDVDALVWCGKLVACGSGIKNGCASGVRGQGRDEDRLS